jgi:hypothetical protein
MVAFIYNPANSGYDYERILTLLAVNEEKTTELLQQFPSMTLAKFFVSILFLNS